MKKFLLIIFTLLFFFGCYSKVEKNANPSPSKDVVTPTSLPPQSALVEAEILSYKKSQLEIKIVRVLEYGANTHNLKNNAILKLGISENQNLSVGTNCRLLLGSETNADSGESKVYWSLLQILKEGDN